MTLYVYLPAVYFAGYSYDPDTVEAGRLGYVDLYEDSTYSSRTLDLDFGDGSSHAHQSDLSFGHIAYHTWVATGDVTITVTQDVSAPVTRTVVLHVVPPVAHLHFAPELPAVYAGLDALYAFTSDPESTEYTLDWGDGSANYHATALYGGGDISHIYNIAGDYAVTATVTNLGGTTVRHYTVTVNNLPVNAHRETPTALAAICGTLTVGMGLYPRATTFLPSSIWNSAISSNDSLAWFSYTATADYVLVVEAQSGPNRYELNLEAFTADHLRINGSQSDDSGPDAGAVYTRCRMGFPVQSGQTYLIAVGTGNDPSNPVVLSWEWQQRTVEGACVYVQYGFTTARLLEAVSVADPTKVDVIAWQGGDSYHNVGASDESGRYVISEDTRFAPYSRNVLGLLVVDDGVWKQPLPSEFESDSNLYLAARPTPNAGAQGIAHVPGTENFSWVNNVYDPSISLVRSTLVIAPPVGDGMIYTLLWNVLPTVDSGDVVIYQLADQCGEFFDTDGTYWGLAYTAGYYWNSGFGYYTYGGGNAGMRVVHLQLNADHTTTLLDYIQPLTNAENPYNGIRPRGIAKLNGKIAVSYVRKNVDAGYDDQYGAGMFIRYFNPITGAMLEEFEFRPFPVLPRPEGNSGASEAGWRTYSFYAQGYMMPDPADPNYFFMTNQGTLQDGTRSHSFLFRIPVADVAGSRYAAMRTPWANWDNVESAEIYMTRSGVLGPISTPSCVLIPTVGIVRGRVRFTAA